MNQEQFEREIVNYVEENPGCKSTVLVADLGFCAKEFIQFERMPQILEDMVSRGLLREEEYIDPAMPYRIKSKFYPAIKN